MIGKGLAKFNFLVKFSLWMLGCQILALACFSLLSVAVRLKESPIKDAAIGEQGRLQQDASKMFEFMTGTRESAFRKGFRLDLNREGFRKKKRLSEVIETLQKHWDKNFPVHKIDVNRLIRNFKSATIAAVKLKIDKKWPEAEKELIANNATASFNILVYTGGDLDDPSDIAVMQGHPDSNHATFALASTMFGALEGGMINPYIKLEQMLNSPSLGEWAAISAYPGTVIRKYLPEDTKGDGVPSDRPTSHLLYFLNVRHAGHNTDQWWLGTYPQQTRRYPRWVWARYGEKRDQSKVVKWEHEDILSFGVPTHVVPVVLTGQEIDGGGSWVKFYIGSSDQQSHRIVKRNIITNRAQWINQFFAAAVDMSFWDGTKGILRADPTLQNLAKMVQRANYIAAILASVRFWLQDKSEHRTPQPRVVLNLVGTVTFRNKVAWAVAGIRGVQRLIEKYKVQVIINWRGGDTVKDAIKGLCSLVQMSHAIGSLETLPSRQKVVDYINWSFNTKRNKALTPEILEFRDDLIQTSWYHHASFAKKTLA
eukprot:GHVN01089964.1.p1 GENE.GHVN01089964.1~~GHVN01089964.1.p1  ORF type:complete len:538 (+),score=63.12 GHVN01089964.1:1354-2967(+)